MSDFTQIWASADSSASEGPPPEDTYDPCALLDADVFTSKKGERWFKATWRVLDGEHKGHEWDDLGGFKTPKQAGFTKDKIAALGVDVDSITDEDALKDALGAVIGGYYELRIVQNGEFRNTYVEGRSRSDEGSSDIPNDLPEPAVEPTDDEDIPF